MEGTNPVNKKLAAALSGGAVLAMALSACSSGDDNSEKLDAWAKQVCDAVKPQAKKIEAANLAIQKETSDSSAPKDVQKTDAQAFQDMSDAYKAIGAAVQKAGAPDTGDSKNAEKKQLDAVKELNTLSASYASLKKQVDELDTKDQGKFADGLKDVATELDKLSTSGSDALKNLEEGDVGKAMAQQASCKSASTTPSATTG
ncbi:MAG: small secreted protein [Streptomyces sp.]|uniref:small secreted protein n=1 Tax=Streptomyces sp. NPDC051913 TaxID=3365676 RepID=UPI00185E34BE|nr:small secreted protein [Streptomyces sp.]NUR42542.1 small secreted protein [Streptomyces sp.]NUR65663.1 small secreted protein [Streptomyces sp.]NUS30645.1 small secreted protein [Streptomyces sp.]NUS78526.1 small secreted protein [Streptomyces sp.]